MYQNRSANIDTRIGTGEAIVGNKQALDLSQTGSLAARNSDAYKKREQQAQQKQAIDDLEFDEGELLPYQRQYFNKKLEDYTQSVYDEKNWEDPNFLQEIDQKARELKADFTILKASTEQYKDYRKKYSAENQQNYKGIDELKMIADPNYDIDPSLDDLGTEDVAGLAYEAMDGVQKVADTDWRAKEGKLPTVPLQEREVTNVRNGREFTSTVKTFSQEDKEDLLRKGKILMRSGRNTLNGTADIPNEYDKALFKEARADVFEEFSSEINGLEPKEKEEFIEEKLSQWYLDQVLDKNKASRSDVSAPADEDSGMGAEDYQNSVLDIKKRVNDFQVEQDPSILNKYLASSKLRVQVDGDNYYVEKAATTGSGDNRKESWDRISPNIPLSDAETLYDVIGKEQSIPDKYFGDVDLKNTKIYKDEYLNEKQEFESKLEENNALDIYEIGTSAAQRFYDNELGKGKVKVVSADKIKVKGKDGKYQEYNVSEGESAKEAYDAIIEAWSEGKEKITTAGESGISWQ